MRICAFPRVVLAATLLSYAVPARAQLYEAVGTRAQGMGGAFVSVADDATAAWWNPAGLASGAFMNLVLEKGALTEPRDPNVLNPARRTAATGFALAFPALGVSYYRLQIADATPINPTANGVGGRQPEGGPGLGLLVVSQFGVTVGQSLGDHVVIGSTLKILRGGASTADVEALDDGVKRAAELEVESHTRFDLDLGAMLRFGRVHLGAALRNATRPHFGTGDALRVIGRQARTGISATSAPAAGFESLMVAADADLTRTPTPFGDVRHASTGVEAWGRGHKFGIRGGATINTVGDRRQSFSTGVSVAPIKGFFIEASKTIGADDSLTGWSSTLRFAF